ncbi:MAG: TonB-dependent receptor [Paucibacter sp.]|nr:TonB-dependent receptor [Roseateles sp.]
MRRPTRPSHATVPQKRHKLAALILPCMAALLAPAAWAQDAPKADATNTPTADAKSEKLDRVTVMATRRREPVRDVPLRVEVLSTENLQQSGAATLSDYIANLPGVEFQADGGPGRGQLNVRGVGVGTFGGATVGTYIDDVALGSSTVFTGTIGSSALDMSLLDLNHIELLRGPQGTLYGAGAMGGLLKYVTNEPDTYNLSGKVGLGVRETHNGALGHTENAVINVPLSEGAAGMRVALFNEHDGGYVDAVGLTAGNHVNDGNTHGGRVSLLLEPTSRLKIRLTATEQNIERNGTNAVAVGATGQPLYRDLSKKLWTAEPYSVKNTIASGDVEYDFGGARLNLIASDQRLKSSTAQDLSSTVYLGLVPGSNFVVLNDLTDLHKQTEELRLTSAPGTVEWILGAYHNKESTAYDQAIVFGLPGGTNITAQSATQPSTFSENAFYGDLTYNATRALSLTVGARVARNHQTYSAAINGKLAQAAGGDDSSNTYLTTARYSLDPTSSVYVRAASGYRPGGPNPPAVLAGTNQIDPAAPKSFHSDSLWSYEAGYKSDLLDKRLSLEAAVFDIHWNKLQQSIAFDGISMLTNAGNAESKGLELSAGYQVDTNWSLNTALTLNDAKLTENAPNLGAAGSRIPNVSRFSASFGANYAYSLAGKPTHAGLNLRYVGQRNAGYDSPSTTVHNFDLPAYTLLDANWGIDFGRWQLAAYVRNLTDRRGLVNGDTGLTTLGGPVNVTVVTPRTVGANLSFNF